MKKRVSSYYYRLGRAPYLVRAIVGISALLAAVALKSELHPVWVRLDWMPFFMDLLVTLLASPVVLFFALPALRPFAGLASGNKKRSSRWWDVAHPEYMNRFDVPISIDLLDPDNLRDPDYMKFDAIHSDHH